MKNCNDKFRKFGIETRIEASQRAEKVWPPSNRFPDPTGYDSAKAFLSNENRIDCEDDIEFLHEMSNNPELYKIDAVRERLSNTFAQLPRDFFNIFNSGKRNIFFYVTPGSSLEGLSTETCPIGPASSRIYTIVLKKDVIETEYPKFFDGVVIHELCHVFLDHPDPSVLFEDPQKQRLFVNKVEKEAIQLALEIGFKDETEFYINLGPHIYFWSEDMFHSVQKMLKK